MKRKDNTLMEDNRLDTYFFLDNYEPYCDTRKLFKKNNLKNN